MSSECRQEHFLPIEDYGIIGNLHTVALVSKLDASIDHFCFPHFDSPLVFGRLLTRVGGGFFQVAPADCGVHWTPKQRYLPSSNVLVTRFLGAAGGIGKVTDLLPVMAGDLNNPGGSLTDELLMRRLQPAPTLEGTRGRPEIRQTVRGWPWVVRKVETIRGTIRFRVQCQPAFDYGRASHRIETNREEEGEDAIVDFVSPTMTLRLTSHSHCPRSHPGRVEWAVVEESVTYEATGKTVALPKLEGLFELGEHQSIYFLLRQPDDGYNALPGWDDLERLLNATDEYWHRWISGCTYKGRWREMVERSALALKLMTFAPTGAIIAAPTLSLPEEVGGEKNWDYRFTWIRDAAFTVYAFLRIGLKTEAADFMTWIEQRCRDIAPDDAVGLRLMYDIHGRHPTVAETGRVSGESVLAREVELSHWTGYRDSSPVRIGNLAALQQQLDIYGELMDAIYLCDKYVRPVSWDIWQIIRKRIIPQVLRRWNERDHGIWEARGQPRHHVYSKVMAWVAVDRGIRLAAKRSLPTPSEWLNVRNDIYESVMQEGYSESLGVFTQYYGGESLDASNLVMPLVFFIAPDDPRFLRTLEQTLLPPKLGGLTVNHLVFRYHPVSGEDPEGTFSICSFWLVEALARAGVRHPRLLKEARLMFEDIIGYANHLGLFGEEIGLDGSALGNFPQAFTHLSLISAAFNLDRALG